jgi:uridine phosphorylase
MAKKRTFTSAELVSDREGRQYHIGCKPGDVAPYILMCGDLARARRVAAYFDHARPAITHREYITITGEYKNIPLTVMATGMGPDNTEIAVVEIAQIVENPTMLRIGSCGALKKKVGLADLVISTGAVRLENTSTYFVHEGYPALAHHECLMALIEAVTRKKIPHHVGITATAPGFYGAQARRVPGFPPRDESLLTKLEAMNVLNIEMETSCLFTLAALRGFRAGAVCAAYSNRHENVFIDTDTKDRAEKRCIETGLEAIRVLAAMDAKKKRALYWLPSMGL